MMSKNKFPRKGCTQEEQGDVVSPAVIMIPEFSGHGPRPYAIGLGKSVKRCEFGLRARGVCTFEL